MDNNIYKYVDNIKFFKRQRYELIDEVDKIYAPTDLSISIDN